MGEHFCQHVYIHVPKYQSVVSITIQFVDIFIQSFKKFRVIIPWMAINYCKDVVSIVTGKIYIEPEVLTTMDIYR